MDDNKEIIEGGVSTPDETASLEPEIIEDKSEENIEADYRATENTEAEDTEAEGIEAEGTEAEIIDSESAGSDGFYNVEVSDSEADEEAARSQRSMRVSAVVVSAFALLGIIAIVIVLITVIKSNDDKEQSKEPDHSVSELTKNDTSALTSDTSAVSEDTSEEITLTEPIDYTDYGVKVTLGDYKNLTIDIPESTVSDEELEASITSFIEKLGLAELREITDRPAQLGDTVIIDYDGVVDGEHNDKTTGTDMELVIGSGSTIDGFEDGIIGATLGESRVLNLQFPVPYHDANFAGKPVDFTITLKSIREKYVPELTDDIVSANTDYKTVGEYRDATMADLLSSKEKNAAEGAFKASVDSLVSSCTFSKEIDNEINDRMEYYRKYYDNYFLQNFGVDAMTYSSMSVDEYNNLLRNISEPEVKYPYVYQEIAKAEGYVPTDKEKADKFNEIFFDMYGFKNEEELYKTFTKKMCDVSVEHELLSSFGYNWLRGSLGMTD
ncbi:MAG: FKBP-type peptidyl-prolyl cis-trans isomerase [Lachnospiraceae bacterium]|nr:FKBP-type peptidyl-prolyl cis-trans isomerase [Lachnospiraceae bacterium]